MVLPVLDFPTAPAIGDIYPTPPVTGQPSYRWDGAQWLSANSQLAGVVHYDAAQTLTAAQELQAQQNIGIDKWQKEKNYTINGAMMVSQENGAAAGSTSSYYPVDLFRMVLTHGGTSSAAQVASTTPGGSPNRLRITATASDATVAAADFLAIYHAIEGYRVVDLQFGTVAAKAITVQFGVKAPAGTYSVFAVNGAGNRCFVADYVITAAEANTDVVKSITIPGDTSGAWLKDNGLGLLLGWSLMCGTTNAVAPGAVWGVGNPLGSTNQFNFMGTGGNVFELFDVSLTEGDVAPEFQVPDYASELALCQRYWQKYVGVNMSEYSATSFTCYMDYSIPEMRTTPTVAFSSITYSNASGLAANVAGQNHIRFAWVAGATTLCFAVFTFTASARL